MAAPKPRRRGVVRSKTGCTSCRTRRKKCDETKPICSRCKKDQFTCQYAAPKTQLLSSHDRSSPSRPESVCLATSPGSGKASVLDDELTTGSSLSSMELDYDNNALQLLYAPSSPWSFKLDQLYIQYYLHFLAPIYATTTGWHQFYYTFVPQLAWQHSSVHHAIVVLAATYEACSTGSDTRTLVLSRANQAFRAFAEESTSTDVALAVSRLLASADQCSGDFIGSMLHLGAAKKIVLDAIRCKQRQSEVANLMTRSLIALSPAEDGDNDLLVEYNLEAQHIITNLKDIRLEYAAFLRYLRGSHWLQLRPEIRELVLVAWSTICRTMNAMLSPDVCTINDHDPLIPVAEVRKDLHTLGKLQNSDELRVTSLQIMNDCIQYTSDWGFAQLSISTPIIQQMKTCIDNYVVLAADVEPRMNAGTYWHDESHPQCAKHQQILYPQLIKNLGCGEGLTGSVQSAIGPGIEYVCPFRSGFGPAFLR